MHHVTIFTSILVTITFCVCHTIVTKLFHAHQITPVFVHSCHLCTHNSHVLITFMQSLLLCIQNYSLLSCTCYIHTLSTFVHYFHACTHSIYLCTLCTLLITLIDHNGHVLHNRIKKVMLFMLYTLLTSRRSDQLLEGWGRWWDKNI